jgi:4-hydroxybenzoate polyprenyltransferase
MAFTSRPLCVDLDGTLVKTDLLIESALTFLRQSPLRAFNLIIWLLRGRATLKHQLAEEVELDTSLLPLNSAVVDMVAAERAKGRQCILVSASNLKYVRRVAEQTGLFDDAFGSDINRNLAGRNKADFLKEKFGEGGFDYIGNDGKDMPVWSACHTPVVANASNRVIRKLRKSQPDAIILESQIKHTAASYLRAIRPHQWSKNMLVFVPLITAHQYGDQSKLVAAAIAFASFSLAASAVYIVNDLVDFSADRRHRTKRNRPIAAGIVDLRVCILLAPVLALLAILLSTSLSPLFVVTLTTYLAITSVYSFSFKNKVLVDVMTLASLYTIRVIAGGVAVDVPLSFWLLAFSMFLFFSLALAKRYTEIVAADDPAVDKKRKIRGYRLSDAPIISSLGISSGLGAVLVLALYINSEAIVSLYATPEFVWILCPILMYWTSRVWMKSHRGEMHDDPVVFALTDRNSIVLAVIAAIAFGLATTPLL